MCVKLVKTKYFFKNKTCAKKLKTYIINLNMLLSTVCFCLKLISFKKSVLKHKNFYQNCILNIIFNFCSGIISKNNQMFFLSFYTNYTAMNV